MKYKSQILSLLAVGLITAGLTACVSENSKEAALAAKAKISRTDAEKTALTQVPNGTVKEGELEEEGGKLIWSFDVSTPGTKDITEVNVNAVTGEMVSKTVESAKAEAKEKD